jgi:hypothetical protein
MSENKSNSKSINPFFLLLWILVLLLVIAGVLGIILLTNVNLAENWLGIDEYTLVETRNQLTQYIPYVWYLAIILAVVIAVIHGIRKKKKSPFYWLFSVIILPIAIFAIGAVTTWVPFDRNYFREETSASAIMEELTDKKVLQGQDVQLISYSFHIRNVPLKSGVYAVARVINPTTNLEDEYWYYPTNILQKWKKDSDTMEISNGDTISYDKIDWSVIPKIIKDTESRVAKLDRYYPGVSIVILNSSQGEWSWTVGVTDIRGYTALNYDYDLSGKYLSMWK